MSKGLAAVLQFKHYTTKQKTEVTQVLYKDTQDSPPGARWAVVFICPKKVSKETLTYCILMFRTWKGKENEKSRYYQEKKYASTNCPGLS